MLDLFHYETVVKEEQKDKRLRAKFGASPHISLGGQIQGKNNVKGLNGHEINKDKIQIMQFLEISKNSKVLRSNFYAM